MVNDCPRVFISYSHDSDDHSARIRGLEASLSRDGCDCRLDVHKDTDEDWPTWMTRQLLEADFILCVTTETYHRRFRDEELPDVGLGVGWEAGLIRRLLYAKKLRNSRIFPVFFVRSDKTHIPLELDGYDCFVLENLSGYEALLRKLHGRMAYAKSAVGTAPDLKSQTAAPLFEPPGGDGSSIGAKEQDTVETGGDRPNRLTIRMDLDRGEFNELAQRSFVRELANLLGTSPERIAIEEVRDGSIVAELLVQDDDIFARLVRMQTDSEKQLEAFREAWKISSIEFDADVDIQEAVRNRVQLGVLGILSNYPEATDYLVEQLGGMNECEQDAKRERAARHLLDSRLADFLPLVIDGFARHARQRTVAEAFRDLATYVLPQIYRKDFLLEIRRRLNSGNFLEIPASHKSIVELLVAGAQGHKLSFDRAWQYEGDVPTGKFEIAPSAELGVLDAKKIQKFVEGFERAIMTKIGGLAGQFRDQTRAINKVLAKRRAGEFGKPPTRYYYLYPDGHGRIDELELRYPHVIFICHEKTDFDDDEFDILHCLQEMFCTEPESDP